MLRYSQHMRRCRLSIQPPCCRKGSFPPSSSSSSSSFFFPSFLLPFCYFDSTLLFNRLSGWVGGWVGGSGQGRKRHRDSRKWLRRHLPPHFAIIDSPRPFLGNGWVGLSGGLGGWNDRAHRKTDPTLTDPTLTDPSDPTGDRCGADSIGSDCPPPVSLISTSFVFHCRHCSALTPGL